VLTEVLATLPLGDPAERALVEDWARAVGQSAAAHSSVERLENGRLTVAVDHPVQHYEWMMRREEWRGKLNGFLGTEAIKEVQVKLRNAHGR
jgi:predicted nucleic acid-binding Zn ribbon protein